MIFLENTSRVHDPWGTREVHILILTISTCLCRRSQWTIINQTNSTLTISTCPNYNPNFFIARTISACPNNHNFSITRTSPRVRIIITRSQHRRSPCVRPLLIPNLMSVHEHNMISNKGDDAISQ